MNTQASRDSESAQPAELRRRAEDRLRADEAHSAEVASVADARALVHELQVHQIELQMQNEELQRARMEAEEASEKYYDLFDFAPTGHFLWDYEGRIREVNLAGAALLGLDRSAASQKRFGQFVAAEFRDTFGDFLARVLATDAKQTCEVKLQRNASLVSLLVEGIAAQDRQGPQRICRAVVIDITQQKRADELAAANEALQSEIAARKQAEETLRQAKEEWEQTFNTVPDLVAILDDQHRIVRANRPMAERMGMTPEQCVGRRCYEVVHGMAEPPDYCPHTRTCQEGREHTAEMHEPHLGGHFLVSTTPRFDELGRLIGAVHVARDITQRKAAETNQALLRDILQVLNRGDDQRALIAEALRLIRRATGFDAVGLRLRQGDDCPYYEHDGFTDEFLREENFLCERRGDGGEVLRDAEGRVMLECTCGLVLSGKADPTLPFFTEGGSFWTNVSTELLALPAQSDPRIHPRNRCIQVGYQSVGLFPVRAGQDIIGLLQLNDRRQGRFTPELIAFYEALAQNIGLALQRMAVEVALKESAEKFRAFFQTAAVGTAQLGLDGRFIEANDRLCQITGFSREELLGMTPAELTHRDDRQRDSEHLSACLQGLIPDYRTEKRYVRKDGQIVWVQVTAALVRDAAGNPVRSAAVIQDITERRRTEGALRESERFINSVAEASPHWFYVFDFDGMALSYANRPIMAYLGYPPDVQTTVTGLDAFRRFMPPEEMPHLARLIENWQSLPDGFVRDDEYRLRHADGTFHYFAGREIVFSRHEDGTVRQMLGLLLDITERKRAEAALRESEERFRGYFEMGLIGMAITSPAKGFMQVNDCFCDMLGYSREELSRFTWEEITHPDDLAADVAQFNRMLAGEIEGYALEKRFTRKDGSPAYAHLSVRGIRDAVGGLDHVVAFAQDITERKRAEEALRQAKAAAEAANEAKGRFLADISHELRTPMNAILGMVDLALPRPMDPMAKDFLQTARESADLLLALLNDLLDSAKIEAKKLELESAPFSLRRVLDQLAQVLSVRAREKGISFSCTIPPELPDAFVGDRVRLRQVISNLGENAVKFTERGEVTVSVRLESQNDETTSLAFAVRDTGIGIPRSQRERIFDPFAQADVSTTRRFGGTGLGLSISLSLVQMMGGRLWVESEPGHGSTFYFTVRMPLAKGRPAEPAARDVLASATSPLRILLVEDNPANQKFAAYVLGERGHTVEIAGDGHQGLSMAQQNHYDVILMDVQMPGMDGLEATAAIRAREGREKRTPIIAMTAHAMKGDRERCLAGDMDDYLSKPIDGHEMIALVESLAGGATRLAPLPAESEPGSDPAAVVFDHELALQRCVNSRIMLRDMIQCFYDEVDNLFPQMQAALQKGDLVEVGRLGRRMKRTVVYLGAEPARGAAIVVERFERQAGEQSVAEEAVRVLQHECMVLKAELDTHPLAADPPQSD